jgi:hypothetical protein
MPSFYAKYWSSDLHKGLLGGVQQSQTSRFERVQDAKARLDQIIELNPQAKGEVLKSTKPPESSAIAQAVCPRPLAGGVLPAEKFSQFTTPRKTLIITLFSPT